MKDALTVTNHNAKPITLKVYAGDAFSTADGALDLQAADTKPTDVGAWIAVSPRQSDRPGQQDGAGPVHSHHSRQCDAR